MAFAESLKLNVKKKAHFQCCLCHDLGVEIHHIVPQGEGGPDDEENAAPLCPTCHETYGDNPKKRKFIREARDFWYDICESRYASDKDQLDRIARAIEERATTDDVARVLSELSSLHEVLKHVQPNEFDRDLEWRSDVEILSALEDLFDKVWYNRHHNMLYRIEHDGEHIEPEILASALAAAELVRARHGESELGPWDDFEWGMLNGKLSALRWVLGEEWDFLDT